MKNVLIAILSVWAIVVTIDSISPENYNTPVYIYNGSAEEFPNDSIFVPDVICGDTVYMIQKYR